MPTTAEVEARLRRTAAACEPIVEDLLGAVPPDAAVAPVPRRPRRTGWLVAAALVVAVAVAGGLAVDRDEGGKPAGDVETAGPAIAGGPPPTTDPAAANPALDTPVTLADGTEAVLAIPGPERWTPRFVDVDVALDGVEHPVEVSLATMEALDDPPAEEVLSDRARIVEAGGERALLVEVDGWGAVLGLASDGGDLPDERVEEVARDLTFRVTAGGPVHVGGTGIAVREVRTLLTREGDTMGMEATLTVARVPGRPHPICVGDPPVSEASRTQRCVADDVLLLSARGSRTQTILPGVEGAIGATATGEQHPVSFPDGTEAVVTIPGDDPWPVVVALAWVAIEGDAERGVRQVRLFPESAIETAARTGSTMEEVDDLRWVAHAPDGTRRLLVQEGGWTAELELDDPVPLPDGVLADLVRTMDLEPTAAGPGPLTGQGLVVTYADVRLGDLGDPDRPETQDVLGLSVDLDPCTGSPGRCLAGEVRATPFGTRAGEVLDGLTAEVVRPPGR